MDISSLFPSLPNFPNLHYLVVDIPFEEPALSDPSGLSRFLEIHSDTLRDVQLTPRAWRTSLIDADTHGWINWLESNLSHESVLANLHSLLIAVPWDPHGVELPLAYISRSADTLTSLSLVEHFLTYTQIDRITSSLSRRTLRHLGFKVEILTPSLLDLLAKTLPDLQELEVYIFSIASDSHIADDDDDSRVTDVVSLAFLLVHYARLR
jgi:hypothetical protein